MLLFSNVSKTLKIFSCVVFILEFVNTTIPLTITNPYVIDDGAKTIEKNSLSSSLANDIVEKKEDETVEIKPEELDEFCSKKTIVYEKDLDKRPLPIHKLKRSFSYDSYCKDPWNEVYQIPNTPFLIPVYRLPTIPLKIPKVYLYKDLFNEFKINFNQSTHNKNDKSSHTSRSFETSDSTNMK